MPKTTIIDAIRATQNDHAKKGASFTASALGYSPELPKAEKEDIKQTRTQWMQSLESMRMHAFQWYTLKYNRMDTTAEREHIYASYRELLRQADLKGIVRPAEDTLSIMVTFAVGTDKWDDERAEKLPAPVSADAFRGRFERFIMREADQILIRDGKTYAKEQEDKKQARAEAKRLQNNERSAMFSQFIEAACKLCERQEVETFAGRMRKEVKKNEELRVKFDAFIGEKQAEIDERNEMLAEFTETAGRLCERHEVEAFTVGLRMEVKSNDELRGKFDAFLAEKQAEIDAGVEVCGTKQSA